MMLAEQDDEWQDADGRYFSVGSMTKVHALEGGEYPKELLAQIAEKRGSRSVISTT